MIDGMLLSLGLLTCSGFVAFAFGPRLRWCTWLGAGGAILGSAAGLVPAIWVLGCAPAESLYQSWSVPYASLALELDALSAWFKIGRAHV